MRIILFISLQFILFSCFAKTILVSNEKWFLSANKTAQPGDTIILKNGSWENVSLILSCNGNSTNPIVVKAETQGRVIISGLSNLRIGGSYIIVDGLYFTNGYSGDLPVINFSMDKKTLANNCRVTNTVINDFNNPKRLEENYWIALYGKNNRIDHSTFLNKKNLGVLLAVILEDEKSRNNFHSIDHNYFGKRLPLTSNTGEIIRVGVSQHCEFNSNTQIVENIFEQCDGETEIISIKSCHNVIKNNVFKECQGSVVLRHGNYNIVENNVFLGNDKEGTGGVRIINKGQWVVNNLFYKCRGEGFRSPISIMNGVPNSPAFRYVPVENAIICNNSFIDCSPFAFCDGSDTERSVIPINVQFRNNVIFNAKDNILYKAYDAISGFSFSGNVINNNLKQAFPEGFITNKMVLENKGNVFYPKPSNSKEYSLKKELLDSAKIRATTSLSSMPGASINNLLVLPNANDRTKTGAKWFTEYLEKVPSKQLTINCKTSNEIVKAIEKNGGEKLVINLTNSQYSFISPLKILGTVSFISSIKKSIKFSTESPSDCLAFLKAGSYLSLSGISLNLENVSSTYFLLTDTSGSSNHSKLSLLNCHFTNIQHGFFKASKSSVFDSIIVSKCTFSNTNGVLFSLNEESDKKGYYNVEHLLITGNIITNHVGQLLTILRSGNDESTMGPSLLFANNKISITKATENNAPLISLTGVQKSIIENNTFSNCHQLNVLIEYKDFVRASHHFQNNILIKTGSIESNKFVVAKDNHFQ